MAPANTEMTLPVIVTSLRNAQKADDNEQMPNKEQRLQSEFVTADYYSRECVRALGFQAASLAPSPKELREDLTS